MQTKQLTHSLNQTVAVQSPPYAEIPSPLFAPWWTAGVLLCASVSQSVVSERAVEEQRRSEVESCCCNIAVSFITRADMVLSNAKPFHFSSLGTEATDDVDVIA